MAARIPTSLQLEYVHWRCAMRVVHSLTTALQQNVQIVVNGRTEPVGGTSCAAPIWAGIISLLNNERFQAGKGPLGFLNQILYENPSAMTDIVKGSNPYMCCPVRVVEGMDASGWCRCTGHKSN